MKGLFMQARLERRWARGMLEVMGSNRRNHQNNSHKGRSSSNSNNNNSPSGISRSFGMRLKSRVCDNPFLMRG